MMLVIFGPTATGKTSLSLKLAKQFNGEIISADSRQVYKGLDIGSGKISKDISQQKIVKGQGFWQIGNIKIHAFDIKNPGEQFSAADFAKFAKAKINQIEKAGKLAIVAGGTGFYIYSLLNNMDTFGIKPNLKLRKKLSKLNSNELYHMLLGINPPKTKSLNESDRNNPRRLIRAIEIAKSKSKRNIKLKSSSDVLLIGLTAHNEYLYQKADLWLDFRLKHGMMEEVQDLIEQKVPADWLINLGLEYRWLTKYLHGQIPKELAVERLKGDIHSLIRKQKTFFNKFPQINLFDITDKKEMQNLEKIINLWYKNH